MNGNEKKPNMANEIRHPSKVVYINFLLSLIPSLFTIIGFKAFKAFCENVIRVPEIWLAIPCAAFNMTPQKWLIMIPNPY